MAEINNQDLTYYERNKIENYNGNTDNAWKSKFRKIEKIEKHVQHTNKHWK